MLPEALHYYYLLRRGLGGPLDPGARHMRELRHAFYRDLWQSAAARAGAQWIERSATVADIAAPRGRLRVADNVTSLDDPATLILAGDKPAVYRLLRKAGIAVPRHNVLTARNEKRLARVFDTLGPPLVVKPAADTGAGQGVSTNVSTRRQLDHAFAWACAFGKRVLIERQIEGQCFRVLLLDGEVLDIVLRHRVSVIGDGRSTIRALIARENKSRLERGIARAQVLVRRDPDLDATLRRQGLRPGSRPCAGAAIELKRTVNDNSADENEAANDVLGRPIIDAAREAAAQVGVRLAGVDVICRDPARPLADSGGAVIEVNATPGLYYHYHRRGAPSAVADRIVAAALACQPIRAVSHAV